MRRHLKGIYRLRQSAKNCLFLLIFLPALNRQLSATENKEEFSEYQLKAEFVQKLAEFVDWPQTAENPETAFIIAIAGKDPLAPYLDKAAKKRFIKGKKIDILLLPDAPAELPPCQLLFLSDRNNIKNLIILSKKQPVLLVGNGEKVLKQGAHIALYRYANRIRFSVNLQAARQARLELSSKLLRLADFIYKGENK